jgi:hypothetical protein
MEKTYNIIMQMGGGDADVRIVPEALYDRIVRFIQDMDANNQQLQHLYDAAAGGLGVSGPTREEARGLLDELFACDIMDAGVIWCY